MGGVPAPSTGVRHPEKSPEAPALSTSWTHTRARIAATKRHHPDVDTSDLERELRAAKAEDYLRRLVADGPRLTDEQKARLAVLLRPTAA